MNTKTIRAVRIILLALIVLGLGLIAMQAYWLTPVVNQILAHEPQPVIVPVAAIATSTATKPVTHPHPAPVPAPVSTSGVDGTVTIGPTCPVVQNPPADACADKPYETTLVLATTIIGRNGGVLIRSDAQGHFSQDLGPGTYTIRAQSDAVMPRLAPITFTVEANKRTSVNVQFDSGIR
ncbi:MAG: hypothetical protein JWL88_693 [Parcubacteria group bacterium]|nr:hypothetical protein [Parcubacteria group bacterium]